MNIVKITENSVELSTGLKQEFFAKTNNSDFSKKCTIVHIEGTFFTKKDYFFDSTKADQNGNAVFTGEKFNGVLLSEMLEKNAETYSDDEIFAFKQFFRAIDFLADSKDFSYSVGAGGIVIKTEKEKNTADILFISGELFEECASHLKEDYSDLQGKYIYKGLSFPSSLYFLRAVVAYKILTNHFPFENSDTTKRQEDIFDHNFIPLHFWTSKISEDLTKSIESALKLTPKQELLVGKRRISDSKKEKLRTQMLENAKEFDCNAFQNSIPLKEESNLSEKRAAFIKKQKTKLATKRFARRNKNRILAGIVAVFVISWFAFGVIRQNAKLITTKGLTSEQTTHALYTMIHRADVPNLQEIVSGSDTKDLILKMSSLYVSSKQRLEISPDNGTLPPAKWFFYKKASKNWMFGLTNLVIDEKNFKIEEEYHSKKEKPEPIASENGKILKKGDEITHTATYFFVRQQEARFIIEKMTDIVTLRWNGTQWKVVNVEGKATNESIKSKDFIEEYFSMVEENLERTFDSNEDAQNVEITLEESEKSIREAVRMLREKYDWIPSDEDFYEAAEELFQKYKSVEASKFLTR